MTFASSPLDHHLGRFEAEFTFGELVRKAFKAAEIELIYAAPVSLAFRPPAGSWQLHAKLPRRLEDHFGVTRQFLVFCARVHELQPRDVTHIKKLIAAATHPIEPDFAIIVTDDPHTAEKLNDWAVERSEGIVIVPLSRQQLNSIVGSEHAPQAIPGLIEQWLSARNLYDERDPVTGDRFFGRGDLLRDLDRGLAQSTSHVGVFGLRRIGKTSLLHELENRLKRRPAVTPIYLDLEVTQSAAMTAAKLGRRLAQLIAARTNTPERMILATLRLPEHPDDAEVFSVIPSLGHALGLAFQGGALDSERLIILLDEAEILLPSPTDPGEGVVDLFRMLRGVAQETRQLTLVLAGVNATPSESPMLGDKDNPLFGLLSLEYLGPLIPSECEDMIRKIGRRMQVRWDSPAALTTIAEAVGGHPLLARLVASDVVSNNEGRPLRPTVKMVNDVLRDFPSRRAPLFEQMVHSLRRYYPDELEFLRIVASGDIAFAADLANDSPTVLNHLAGYGLVNREELTIRVPVFQRWLRLQ